MAHTGSGEVRIGHSLNEAERLHVTSRRKTVQQCLQQHKILCSEDTAPNIAVLGSGGGERAMIGLLGSLNKLCEEKLLDSIMYLSGVSGSTWCMASVYKEQDWSHKMDTIKQNIIQKLTSDQVSHSQQKSKLQKMFNRNNFSLTDIWAACIVSKLVKEIDEGMLTGHRGQYSSDPYPIYTVIDKQCKQDKLYKDSWFEITPDECGYSLTGAFVETSSWGSQFKKGAKTEEHPESDMLYLQGLCGSALADGEEIKKSILERLKDFFGGFFVKDAPAGFELQKFTANCRENDVWKGESRLCSSEIEIELLSTNDSQETLQTLLDMNLHFLSGEDLTHDITKMNQLLEGKCDKQGNELKLQGPITEEILKEYTLKVCDSLSDWYPEVKGTGTNEEVKQLYSWKPQLPDFKFIYTCMKKLWNWDWGTTYNFLCNMAADEVHPSILQSKTRKYEDAGLLLNSPYFSVLREKRNIDLIISLDFSAGDPFETVKTAAQMCKDLHIPFPTVEINRKEIQDFYVFKDNPKAPTVIHIPLFNEGNCKGEVKEWKDRYQTFQSAYDEKMINDLLEKAGSNIKNTKEKLLKEIEEVVKGKKK